MTHTYTNPSFETLDRGVLLIAISGILVNAIAASLGGILLTVIAGIFYGLARNRTANTADFEVAPDLHTKYGITYYRQACLWLGSIHIYYGVISDAFDCSNNNSVTAARREVHQTLWPAIWLRLKEKVMSLLWLERFI